MPRPPVLPSSRALAALVACAVCTATLALAPAAHADMDEWQLSLGAGYRGIVFTGDPDDVTLHVPGIAGGLWFGIDDYWQLGASAQVGLGLPDGGDPNVVGSVAFEVRYVLDIVEWVPHLTAGVGTLVNAVGEAQVDLLAGIGIGLDYRPAREWGIGVDARYDFVLSDLDGVTAAFHAALVYSRFFE